MTKNETRDAHGSRSGAKVQPKADQGQVQGAAPSTRVEPRDATGEKSRGKATRGADVTANRPHLEGSEQGPA